MALSVDIRKKLGSFHLDVRFEAEQGTPLALLGASGCGKSVTLRCIAGILKPDEGRITLDGTVLYDSAAGIDLPPQRRRVGYLFQQYALFPNMTVRQNIAAAVPNRQERNVQTVELLRRFRLEEVASQRPWQLSGGQQQRCALARILASAPRAILLDEPFSALDGYLQDQLEVELAQTLEQFSGPVVWVSHDRGEVFRNCPQVCVMDRGTSQPVTSLEALFRSPGTEAAARLSGCQTCVRAVPDRDDVFDIFLPEWGLSLSCGRSVPPETRSVGIRAQYVRPAAPGEKNAFACVIVRQIRDETTDMILLRPEGSTPQAPLLRMELPDHHQITENRITVAVAPEDLLLLH